MTTSGWGYRPALDGLRCLAVYLVVVFHAEVDAFSGGFIGVDLFFVLSGYLVTSILLLELETEGRIRLARFYARRVRRLLPAAVVAIASIALVWLIVAPLTERLDLVRDARAALLYVSNWNFIQEGQDYFAQGDAAHSPYVHFWSLSIEEQFYMLFPLLLLGLHRAKASRRTIAGVVGGLFAVSLVLQVVIGRSNELVAYYGTHTRLYQMLAGCLLAIAAPRLLRSARATRFDPLIAPGALVLLVLVGSGAVDVSASNRGIAAMVLSVAVIAGLERQPKGATARVLSRPVPVHLGRISYGTYLWHWPIVLVCGILLDVGPWTTAVIAVVLATAMASISAELLETPIRRAKRLDTIPRPVIAGGLAVSIALAVVIPVVLENERTPAIAASGSGSVTTSIGPVPTGIDWKAVEEDTYGSPPCPADDPAQCIKVEGNGPTVLLVGDSTARTLIPAMMDLATEQDFTFAAQVAQGCPWLIGVDRGNDNDEACDAGRDGWYKTALPILQPDVLVLVQRDYPEAMWSAGFSTGDPAVDALPVVDQQAALTRSTLDALRDLVPTIIVVEPVAAQVTDNPVDCLSGATDIAECVFPLVRDLPFEMALRDIVAEDDGDGDVVRSVDLDDMICPQAPQCIPYLEDEVVWRDEVHVTTWWWQQHRDTLWRELTRAGIPA